LPEKIRVSPSLKYIVRPIYFKKLIVVIGNMDW